MSVRLETTHGSITLNLFFKECPLSSRNFLELAKNGYYDGSYFFKIQKGVLAQSGDPDPFHPEGDGGRSIFGASFPDEINANLSHDAVGVLSMANRGGLNTNGSQFFVTLGPAEHLDGKHSIFGKVAEESLTVLKDLDKVKCKNERPLKPPKIFCSHILHDPWANTPLPVGQAALEERKKRRWKIEGMTEKDVSTCIGFHPFLRRLHP